MNDLKNKLLDLFERDNEIRQAIQAINSVLFSEAEYHNTGTLDKLRKELEKHQQKIEKLNADLELKKNDNNKLESEVEQLKESTENKKHDNVFLTEKVKKSESKIKHSKGLFQKSQKELEESKQMIEKLKRLLGCNEDDKNNLASKVEQLEESLDNEKKEIISLKKITKKNKSQIKSYEDLFKGEIEAYRLFESLSSHTKKSLSGIFKDDSISGFIACGIQERNISNIWEYLKNEVIEDENKDISNLKLIFEFLFSRYVLAHPIYELQQVDSGSAFDPQHHIRHSSSKNVSGDIQDVLLSGWINKKTNKLVKQSVVII